MNERVSLPKPKGKLGYGWFALISALSNVVFIAIAMLLLTFVNQATLTQPLGAKVYIALSFIVNLSFIGTYYLLALKSYYFYQAKLVYTKLRSLKIGLIINTFSLLLYLLAVVVSNSVYQKQAALNVNFTAHSSAMGSLSILGFLAMMLTVIIIANIIAFIYGTHFQFLLGSDLFLSNPEVIAAIQKHKLSQVNDNEHDWTVIVNQQGKLAQTITYVQGVNKGTYLGYINPKGNWDHEQTTSS